MSGNKGEHEVLNRLSSLSSEYRVLHNLIVTKADGHTTEVDCVVVSKYGIFVIEVKGAKGVFRGDVRSKYWRMERFSSHRYNNNCGKIYSPVFQNKKHIKVIRNYLGGIDKSVFRNIVCFSNIRAIVLVNGFKVIIPSNLLDEIQKHKECIIEDEEVDAIYEKLRVLYRPSVKSSISHINDMNTAKQIHMNGGI